MSDRSSSSSDEPRWGAASTHRVSNSARRPAAVGSGSGSGPERSSPEQSGPAQSGPAQSGPAQSEPAQPQWGAPSTPARARAPRRTLPAGQRFPRPHLGGPAKILVPLLVVLLLIGYPFSLARTAMGNMGRVSALPAKSLGEGAAGRNFLVVGSDSRAGTKLDSVVGARADTIMLLHVPLRGKSVLVSIPRDSFVDIPGHDRNKINSAFALGGPKLLVQTVEKLTGISIDDYVQTNLGGFSKVVDAVGGVKLCPKFDMNDKDAHINLKKGCQQMDGATALGFARARHSDPQGDLGRVKRQREVLAAIVKKSATPGTILNPFNAYPLAKAGGQALTVDESTSQWAIYRFLMGMRSVSSDGLSITAPVSNPSLRTSHGLAVELDSGKTPALFKAIRDGDSDKVASLAG